MLTLLSVRCVLHATQFYYTQPRGPLHPHSPAAPIAPPEWCAQPPRNSLRVVRVRACIAPSSIACCARLCNSARVPTRFILCSLLHLASPAFVSVLACVGSHLRHCLCCFRCLFASCHCLRRYPYHHCCLCYPFLSLLYPSRHYSTRRSGTLARFAARVVPPLSH